MNDPGQKAIDPKLVATPFSYAGAVAFQEGAVVSRTIINKPEGTVTVFAFDKGERLSTHSAPYDALLQAVEGQGLVTIEGVEYIVCTPEAIIMPANKPHSVVAAERFKMVLVMIKSK